MHLFRLAYKNIIHRKARFIFTILSVVFGVMFVAGTFTFTDGLRGIFDDVSTEIAGDSSIIVRGKIEFGDNNLAPPIPRELQEVLESIEGVQRVEPGVARDGLSVSELFIDPISGEESGTGDRIQSVVDGPPVIGLGIDGDSSGNLVLLQDYGNGSGKFPENRNEFAIDVGTADANSMELGRRYSITIPEGEFAGPQVAALVGVFRLGEEGAVAFTAQLVVFDIDTAVNYFNAGIGYDQYDIYLEEGFNPAQGVADVERVLASSPTAVDALDALNVQVEAIQTAEFAAEVANFFNGIIDILRNVFLGFSSIILLVSGFVIFNTFSIVLDQRIKEFGLLRAIGLSGRQLMRLVLGEAFIVGLIATIVGLAASVGVFFGFVAFLKSQASGEFPDLEFIISARTVIVAFIVGVGLTMVSALPAALKSNRIPPIAALREGVSATRDTEVVPQPVLGAVVLTAGIGAAIASLFLSWVLIALLSVVAAVLIYWGGTRVSKWAGQFAILGFGIAWLIIASGIVDINSGLRAGETLTLFGIGAIFVFVGVNLLSPLFGAQFTKGLGAPIKAVARVIGNLGVSNAARNPKRTATTAGALMIGIALLSVASILSSSIQATFTEALEGTVRSDLIVCKDTCGPQDTFSTKIVDNISDSDFVSSALAFSEEGEGFKVISTVTNSAVTTRDEIFSVAATDLAVVDEHLNLNLQVENGSVDKSKPNGVYVKKSQADEYNLEIGSTVDIQFPSGAESTLEVVGIFNVDATIFRSEWLVQSSLLNENVSRYSHFAVSILLKSGLGVDLTNTDDPVLGTIRDDIFIEQGTLAIDPDLAIQTKSQLNEQLQGDLDQTLVIISAFLFISFLVAIFGVANTLALSIFERTREIGLLRAIGMKRGQVRRMIVVEGFIIGVFGSLIGVAMGIVFGVVATRVLPDEFVNQLAITPRNLIIYVIVGILAALVGTVIPSIRAGRLKVLQAISQE